MIIVVSEMLERAGTNPVSEMNDENFDALHPDQGSEQSWNFFQDCKIVNVIQWNIDVIWNT